MLAKDLSLLHFLKAVFMLCNFLQKIVLEAVTAILKGGLHVGVLIHGKKVRDDDRTLLQTGLSCKDNLDTVGFTLEPNLVHNTTLPLCSEDPPQMLACDMTEIVPRYYNYIQTYNLGLFPSISRFWTA